MHEETDETDSSRMSRRRVLQATSVSAAVAIGGTSGATASDGESERMRLDDDCPETTTRPSHGYCAGASLEGCADDDEVTIELQEAVEETLTEQYPDAGALLEEGFKPYFDTLNGGDGWSHWLSPDHIGDDRVLDPERPESVLVDNESWRSIGVMFIATQGGEAVSPPPVVYDDELGVTYEDGVVPIDAEPPTEPHEHSDNEHDHHEEDGDHADGEHHDDHHGDGAHHDENGDHEGHDEHDAHRPDGPEDRCSPWHYHAGLPGRFAWWYYQTVYEKELGLDTLSLPCRTPCMMHVWTVDHPEGVYAHGGPPPEYRDREPAEEAGFETDAEPGEDDLDWEHLPDDVVPDRLPDEFSDVWP